MSSTVNALRKAIEHEKLALEQYKIVSENSNEPDTQDAVKKMIADKEEKIDTLSWVLVAENGGGEEAASEGQPQNGAEKLASGKCPFSGELAKMGIDISKMKSMDDVKGMDLSDLKPDS